MRIAPLLGLLVLAPYSNVLAQHALGLVPGQRLRLTAPTLGAHDQQFRYVGVRRDTLLLTGDTAVACPFSDLTRLEILQGQRSYKWPGAVLGLAAGALIGVGLGYAFTADDDWGIARHNAVLGGGIGLGIVGAGVGALVGQSIKTDAWKEVPLDRLRVSAFPLRGGRFALGMSVTF
jgi:hypothetical protein